MKPRIKSYFVYKTLKNPLRLNSKWVFEKLNYWQVWLFTVPYLESMLKNQSLQQRCWVKQIKRGHLWFWDKPFQICRSKQYNLFHRSGSSHFSSTGCENIIVTPILLHILSHPVITKVFFWILSNDQEALRDSKLNL